MSMLRMKASPNRLCVLIPPSRPMIRILIKSRKESKYNLWLLWKSWTRLPDLPLEESDIRVAEWPDNPTGGSQISIRRFAFDVGVSNLSFGKQALKVFNDPFELWLTLNLGPTHCVGCWRGRGRSFVWFHPIHQWNKSRSISLNWKGWQLTIPSGKINH